MESPPNSSKTSINTFFGKCRCCLEYGYMKSMWSEYDHDGTCEIYGEMLLETFTVTWESSDETKDYICESCVIRLRDAYDFKKEVLASDELMQEDIDELGDHQFKIEVLEEKIDGNNIQEDELEGEQVNESETEYYEVEYLEEEIDIKGEFDTRTNVKVESDAEKPQSKTKRLRRKRRGEITRVYKNYTEDDMRKCLEAIKQNNMTIAEASRFYGVPRKTVCYKLYNTKIEKKSDDPKELQKAIEKEKQINFIEEIKTVLFYTNAVPFKTNTGKYYCAYCHREYFEDPDELRAHIRSHEDIWLKNIDHILEPHFLNEILRLDIENLLCKACDVPIKTWNDMFQHLKDQHDIDMDQTYTKLVPFRLKRDFMNCALCNESFINFTFVDNHMNTHYCNYMCSECGDTFLTENRLKHHIQIHRTGKFPCQLCGKVFTLEKYMKKHQAIIHKMYKIFKCSYCSERFHAVYERHSHVIEKHNEKIRISTCEICGKTFDWRPYYLAHKRKVHSKEKKNKCKYCPKAFVSKHELKMHEQRHTGSGKHICSQCDKNFVTMTELKLHLKRHFKEEGYINVSVVDS